ncbi:MAG: hypothetical protein J6Y37_03280 [Paludibacteraceae bacterium]|nr:hypothetical protein [Paludibacteraceae bacterium]
MDKLNDPVFGAIEYNKEEKYWTKKIYLNIWGVEEDYEMDLMVKCDKNEEISDLQHEAYKSYLANLKKFEDGIPSALLSYYRDHYEDIDRAWNVDDELKLDVVDEDVLLSLLDIKSLYIDRKGNYGWLVELIWDGCQITFVLSGDKIRIYKGWAVIVMNYALVNDEAFGEMVYEKSSWKKWIKMDINGEKGMWIPVVADAYPGESITPEQRKNYLEYKEKEKDFFDEIPNALMNYYLENYEEIESYYDIPTKYNRQNITKVSLMDLITFHRLYFNKDGIRYGWLCGCTWDTVYGLGMILSGDKIEIGWKDDLFD